MALFFKIFPFSKKFEITKIFTKNYFYRQFFVLFFLIAGCFLSGLPAAMAQLPNKAFEFRRPLVPADSQRIKLGVYLLGFNKNNEYFNKIADGYTLFGIQAVPYLTYQASSRLRIDAGVFARKDFGRLGFVEVDPLLSIRYEQGPVNVIFGTLEGSLNHRLIEPIYDFERVMVDRLEEGLQFLFQRPATFVDVWINWERMIYPASPVQEVVSGGLSFNQQIWGNKRWQLKLPLQLLAFHRGGQIDNNPDPVITRANAAAGLELHRKWESGFIRSLSFQPYLLGFQDFSNKFMLPYKKGHALYVNLSAASRHLHVMLSYWKGEEFVGIKGGALYQSLSTTYKYPAYTEDERELLILRLMLQLAVAPNLEVSTRFEPYYNFGSGKIEFSHGMYLNYKTNFNLFRIRSGRSNKL